MSSIATIIPCYNEGERLDKIAFKDFVSANKNVHFYFVNDGSTDNTSEILEDIKNHSAQVHIISLQENSGKGEAVRQGILAALQNNFEYVGYLDADLSTSLKEFFSLYKYAVEKNVDFVFGSRIKKLDSSIQRSFLRHIIGRGLATVIDKRFKLGCYDTQCGAKVFKRTLIDQITNEKFFTKWFFDVEIFLRIKSLQNNYNGHEYPLKMWQNVKGSKINLLSFPAVLKDLITLLSKY